MTASVFDRDGDLKNTWLIDSGASSHICCQAESFDDLDTTRRPQLDGLGGGVHAEGVGTVRLTVTNGATLTLSDVHFVPSFFTNLISVRRFQSSKDARLTYDGSAWELVHMPSGSKAGRSTNYQGMYALDSYVQKKFVNVSMNQLSYGTHD
ncbi:hypothetical protein V1507DRAFT_469548 [Lipomyces tetrasporus]